MFSALLFYNERSETADHSLAEFIRKNTNYYDVVYSPDYEIKSDSDHFPDLAISKKRIYRVSRLDEIPIRDLPNDAIINILLLRNSIENKVWNQLYSGNVFSKESDNICLFKFSKESFKSKIGLK